MKTPRTIHCQKCRAPESALYPHVRHLEIGVRLQVISCTLCGWQISRPEPHQRYSPLADKIFKKSATLPCTRVGCGGSYSPNTSKRQLCAVCGKIQGSWATRYKHGKTRNPSPLLQQGNVWIINPHATATAGLTTQETCHAD